MAQQIFVSYRRADTHSPVIKLVEYLDRYLNDGRRKVSIYRDESGNVPGTSWKDTIQQKISESDIVLVIIGPHWFDLSDSGKRRIDNPADMVYREIQLALNKNKDTIPVLLNGAEMPRKKELPIGIQALAEIEAQKVQIEGDNTIPLSIFSAFVGLALDKVKKDQDQDLKESLEGEAETYGSGKEGLGVLSIYPEAGGAQFEGMPIFGKWSIQVTCPKGVPPGNVAIKIHLGDDLLCVGDWVIRKSFLRKHRRKLDGKWGLLPGKDSPLILKIEALLDKSEPILFKLPIDGRMGNGYTGRDSDGRTYFFESIKGQPRPLSETL